jgi:signal transduction histidine kinase/DNA-binding response OmpR family regulator
MRRFHIPWLLYGFILCITCQASFTAQGQNRVLQLDGQDDYVQLPSNIFNTLPQATVEAWVKWEKFAYFSQPFGFGNGEKWQVMAVNNSFCGADLQYFIYDNLKLNLIKVPNILKTGQWYHIAVVSGKGGMKLYLNGVMVGEHEYEGSFLSINNGDHNYIGRPLWPDNEYFKGQIDEVRIWEVVRSGEQIRLDMFRKLRGDESGLVGLWNFDSGDARDSSPNGYDGELKGGAHCVEGELPSPDDLARPAVLSGEVTDEMGIYLSKADVRLERNGRSVADAVTDGEGKYHLVFYPGTELYDLSATWSQKGVWKLGIRVRPGEHRVFDLRLTPAVDISGRLLAYDDASLSGIMVQAVRAPPKPSGLKSQIAITTLSDESGKYQFVNLRPGRYHVRCYTGREYLYYSSPSGEDLLLVERGKTFSDVNFRFAPFKKGTWRSYTYLDGLASNKVYAIQSDGMGNLWFGTAEGLSRFDGENFVNFTERDGLAANWVTEIYRDVDGTLWFGTRYGGVSHYDGERFTNLTEADGLISNNVQAIYRDSDGRLWIGTDRGISRFDGENFVNFTGKDGLLDNNVRAISQTSDGALWFGTAMSLARYDGERFRIFTPEDGLVSGDISAICRDKNDILWIGTNAGISRFDGENFVNFTDQDGLVHNFVWSIAEDGDGVLWIGTNAGVSRYDGKGFISFTSQDGLIYPQVRAVYRDRYGILWFGTYRGGVSRYDPGSFVNFTTRDGLAHDRVLSIVEDKEGNLWFGTSGGASRYDGKRFVNFTSRDGLPNDSIQSIYRDADGTLWFGTNGGGICRYDGRRFEVLDEEDGLHFNRVTAIGSTPDGALWVGARVRGISYLDPKRLTFRRLDFGADSLYCHVRSIYSDPDGILWFGTEARGVYRYDGERLLNYRVEDGLLSDKVEAIHRGIDGMLWLATRKGISRYDGQRFLSLTKEDGLPDNQVWVMYTDSEGKLWLGTDSAGVAVYDGTAWMSLNTRDGLANDTVYSIYEDKEGNLWFGTNKGLSRYHRSSSPPTVRIVSVQSDRRYTDLSSIPEITMGERVTIEYQSLDFNTYPGKPRYLVRIREDEGERRFIVSSSYFDWRPQRAGEYILEVQAIGRDLVYSEPARISLKVGPPWYLNGWIIIPSMVGFLALIALASIFGFHYYTQRRVSQRLRVLLLEQERRKNVQLQEAKDEAEAARKIAERANQAKSIFLANMSHEIRTPLNAILGYTQILKRDPDLPIRQRSAIETIEESGNHLLALINDVLDISKIEAGKLELQETEFDLFRLIEGLSVMFQLRCEQKGLVWRVEWNVARTHPLVYGDEGKLRQILMNLLSNAVKFTESGEVVLKVNEVGEDLFRFEIADTGIGISPEEQSKIFDPFSQGVDGVKRGGTGLGLAIAREYVRLMGGEIGMESTVGRGSRFFFSLPLRIIKGEQTRRPTDSGQVVHLADGYEVKALVADDNRENREVLSQLLLDIGVSVITAEDGREAVEAVRVHGPDIVFMDIRMPVMDGIEAVRHILESLDSPPPKIVAVSASALIHEQRRYLEAGFDDFIAKPVRAERIYECLAHLLRVEYEMRDETVAAADPSKIALPEALISRLREAAEYGHVTELERSLQEVEQAGEEGAQLAERLRELSRNFDMEGILRILEVIRHE